MKTACGLVWLVRVPASASEPGSFVKARTSPWHPARRRIVPSGPKVRPGEGRALVLLSGFTYRRVLHNDPQQRSRCDFSPAVDLVAGSRAVQDRALIRVVPG